MNNTQPIQEEPSPTKVFETNQTKNRKTLTVLNYLMLIISLFGLLMLPLLFKVAINPITIIVALLGIIAFVIVLEKKLFGLILMIIWAIIQAVSIQSSQLILDISLIPNFIRINFQLGEVLFVFNVLMLIFLSFAFREYSLFKKNN